MKDNCGFTYVNCQLEARSISGSPFLSVAVGVPVATAAETLDPRRGRGGRRLRRVVAGGRSGLDATAAAARILLVQHDRLICEFTTWHTFSDPHGSSHCFWLIQHILLLFLLYNTGERTLGDSTVEQLVHLMRRY